MQRLAILTLILCLIQVPAAWANRTVENCSSIDLRTGENESLRPPQPPISSTPPAWLGEDRDQGESGLCFANVAADMISQKVGVQVSALDVAITFFFGNAKDLKSNPHSEVKLHLLEHPTYLADLKVQREGADLQNSDADSFDPDIMFGADGIYNVGGDAGGAVLMANTKGLCTEQELPSTKILFQTLVHEVKQLDSLYDISRFKDTDLTLVTPEDPSSPLVKQESVRLANFFTHQVEKRCTHRIPTPALVPIAVGELDDLVTFQERYALHSAARKRYQNELFLALDRNLEAGRLVGVDFNSDAIMKPDPQNDHASSVVARKMIGGQCRYLIRNSFGPDCEAIRPKFTRQNLCEAGNVWVTREELADDGDFYAVHYIK